MTRLYEPQALAIGSELTLGSRALRYLQTVLRAKIADSVTLFNAQGGEYQASIIAISKKEVRVVISEFIDHDLESPLAIHLAQGLPKGDKLDFIVQKAVELGVTMITPIITERTQGRLSKEQAQKKQERLTDIAIAAAEQCGRNRLPIINPMRTFQEWVTLSNEETHRYILTPTTNKTVAFPPSKAPSSICLMVGPEGGFTEEEVEFAIAGNCIPLTMGKRILRTETASIAAISIMQTLFGDMMQLKQT